MCLCVCVWGGGGGDTTCSSCCFMSYIPTLPWGKRHRATLRKKHKESHRFSKLKTFYRLDTRSVRRPSVMDQSKASDHRSHQDTGSNEPHLRLGIRVVGSDQQKQDGNHLLLLVSLSSVHPADQWTRHPPARHPTYLGVKLENTSGSTTSVPCIAKLSGKRP